MEIFYLILLIWNVIVALMYGLDKFFAKCRARRISETTLITLAFLFGGIGAQFGMIIFHHKTSKSKFRFLIPLSVFCNVIFLIPIYRMFGISLPF